MKARDLPDEAAQGSDRKPVIIEARRVGPGARAGVDDFTFTVLLDAVAPEAPSAERRSAPRKRTRLRSGKVVDQTGRFLTECLWHDLSSCGGRLRVPQGAVLPQAIQIYDDQTGNLHQAVVLWRRDRDAGVVFKPAATDARSRAIAADMRRKFYAVRN